MKSFFQLSEQAKKHQKKKILREVGEATPAPAATPAATPTPAPAAGQQQNPAQLVTAFSAAWDKFYSDPTNKAAIAAMQAQKLDTKALDGMSNTLKGYAQQLAKTPAAAPTTATPAAATPAPAPAPAKV